MLVKKHALHIISTHALASKTFPKFLKNFEVTECVNFIKTHALNYCLFKEFGDQMGSEHTVLLYHTKVQWLSRDLILSRVS